MLTFKNVTRLYMSNKGIRNCSWEINNGIVVGLLGNNGCGKTTTFKLLLQLEDKDEGEILYNKRPIESYHKNIFGYVPEERTVYSDCSVYDLLSLIGRIKGVDLKELNLRIDQYLQYFKIETYKNKKIYELSKGNQQLIQIIMALLHEPKILILDEPFNGLDKKRIEEVIYLLKQRKDITLISFHQLEYIQRVCDKVVYMHDGCIERVEEVQHD